ncbi:XrtA/PEP-CTERM system-associated ATPase [Noviherbaspirillum sp. UKPF54]|uniref:XrtA/PEP-CTERM system-associated ATPase n=1 Tax=Noviherbaspirillum sp. UKPF54 TaxID=2601898 RepID=UPI0011B1113C|nr:XrtA/PEP-CTERM system-associated ATPase [Noviherbaspirillum sp. UKPF54]QDZ28990.1 DUF2075 domain-containing protein [Noviherbaspirillum sp. UKPF54]
MYNTYYGLTAKPFQLNPDPNFYFGSKGHSRAMAYLEYGLSQEDGFIVITGEVGAGKTTLVRNLCRRLQSEKIVVAQIVNTALDAADILRMAAASLDLPFENVSKAALLLRLEMFARDCAKQGKRILLIVDEAQNLSHHALEELRMLSNMQSYDQPLLQTFLLGQPEFRAILMSEGMKQLRQRVIATYHLGPLDEDDSRAYIEHRLSTAGWQGDPCISDDAFDAIYGYTQGIPRKINTFCDRMFLMGYLEELHAFGTREVDKVMADIDEEFAAPPSTEVGTDHTIAELTPASSDIDAIERRVSRMESSVTTLVDALRKMISAPLKSVSSKNP